MSDLHLAVLITILLAIAFFAWLSDRDHLRMRNARYRPARTCRRPAPLPPLGSREEPDGPHWEAFQAYHDGRLIGYRVRWSEPDEAGDYLYVGHYLAEPDDLDKLRWYEVAAASDARRKNLEGKIPWGHGEYQR